MGLIQVGSLFVFLTCAIATPIASRSGSIHLPKNYAALGDSFAAGLGSGHFLNSSADGSDIACARQDGSYPTQLLQLLPFLQPHDQPLDFVTCSGDELDDIDSQVAKLAGKKFDILTVTIGGNDFGFGDIARTCAYATLSPGVDAQGLCDAALDTAFAALDNSTIVGKFQQKFDLIKSSALAPGGKIYVTGYATFFDTPIEGDACSQISFFPIPQLAALKISTTTRLRSNEIASRVTGLVKDAVSKAGCEFQFVDFDKVFQGKRFCEQANADDPIGANNPDVFFNDLTTILPTPGVAPLEQQTPGLGGVDITNKLQQISVFHPKGSRPYAPLAAEIAFRILVDAFSGHDVVVGPTRYWRHGSYYEVPEKCAMVKKGWTHAPMVVCENGNSYVATAAR